jgi:hydroxyacylglutathione hydrolase
MLHYKIYRLDLKENNMKQIHVKGNTYAIDTGMTLIPIYKINDQEIILIDSGYQGERAGIMKLLESNHYHVKGILCSHAHTDHIGNNHFLKEKYNCLIAMPAYEAVEVESAIHLKANYGSHSLKEIEEHFGHLIGTTDIWIQKDQTEIELESNLFKIVHTPGHSTSHISIITPDDVLFVGDALISYEVMRGAKLPYAFLLTEDLKSKEKLRNIKCDQYIVAHKGVYDDIDQLISDNIQFYQERAEKVLELITEPMSFEEIMKSILRAFSLNINSQYKFRVIERMIRSYIEYLHDINRITIIIKDGFLKYQVVDVN